MYLLWFTVLAVLASRADAQFSNVGADACSQIIKAGIYNTFQSSSAQSSYSSFQSTMCSDLSTYKFDTYSKEHASSNANSRAFAIDASASVLGIGGSAGYSQSNSQMSSDQFAEFKKTQSAYKQTGCSSSSSNSAFNNAVSTVSNVIDPNVSTSYTNCLKVYATGIQITQNSGVGSRSLSIDIQFVTNNLGASAYITGIKYVGPAVCTLNGPSLPKGANTTFNFKLVPDAVYSVICSLPPTTPADGKISDVYLSTTPGGTYHALLFHSVPVDQLTSLQNQVRTLSASVQNQVRTLSARRDSFSIGAYYSGSYQGGPMKINRDPYSCDFVAPFRGTIVYLSGRATRGGYGDAVNPGGAFVLSVRNNDVEIIPAVTNFPLNGSGYKKTNVKFNAGDRLSIWFGVSEIGDMKVAAWMMLTYDQ